MRRFKHFLVTNYKLTGSEWNDMEPFFEQQAIKKEEFLIKPGKPYRKAVFVAEGVLRYCSYNANGEEITCYFACENGCIMDMESFQSGVSATITVKTVTDSFLVTLTHSREEALISTFPRWKEITSSIAQKAMLELVNQKNFLLHHDAAYRYQYMLTHYPTIVLRTPLSYIASYLGIQPQSLSRLRNQMR
jgi:CRP-like cAMP-binding protein